jgi:outer membrane lipoprotein-sorting protein
LHLKGWVYHYRNTDLGRVPLAYATESFCERPYRQYRTGYSFSDNGRKLTVASRVFVGNGEQSMLIDKENKTATFRRANKLQSELMVEGSLQQRLLDEFGEGDLGDFENVATERIKDVVCDVYELKSNSQPGGRHVDGPEKSIRFRTRLWLNPQNGMPVKAASYSIEPNGTEEILWEWTEIGINVEPPEGMFSFEVPAGYERVEGEPTSPFTAMATMNGGGGISDNGKSASISSGVALNIDDQAVLYCWSLKTSGKDGPQWFESHPEFGLEGVQYRPCHEITLRSDKNADEQVRWSLIVPRDGQRLNGAPLRMLFWLGRSSSSMEAQPLKFDEQRLPGLVEEVQRRTLPAGANAAEIWSLDELRAKFAKAP